MISAACVRKMLDKRPLFAFGNRSLVLANPAAAPHSHFVLHDRPRRSAMGNARVLPEGLYLADTEHIGLDSQQATGTNRPCGLERRLLLGRTHKYSLPKKYQVRIVVDQMGIGIEISALKMLAGCHTDSQALIGTSLAP